MLKREIISECAIHSDDQYFLYSPFCNGFVCLECIKEKFFIEDIEAELMMIYPERFEVEN